MIKILSTKSLSTNAIEYADTLGVKINCVDFIQTEAVHFDEQQINWNTLDAVVFTSSNAVRYFFGEGGGRVPAGKTIFSLSGKTAAELKEYGITPTFTAINAAALAGAIIGVKAVKNLLHVCGNLKLETIETQITSAGINYHPLVVYNTYYGDAQPLTEQYDGIMFFSPSGVQSYLRGNSIQPDVIYCCIGQTTADSLRALNTHAQIIVPEIPSPEAMTVEVARYFQTRQVGTWPS